MNSTAHERTPTVIIVMRVCYMVSAVLWLFMPVFGNPQKLGDTYWTYTLMGIGAGFATMTAPYPQTFDGRPANLSILRTVSPLVILIVSVFNFIRLVI
jgi:hypothetical protein